MISNLRPLACSWLLLLISACSTVPEEQVSLYVQAFDETQAAGNLIYDEISPIVVAYEPATITGADNADGIAAIEPAAGESDPIAGLICPEDLGPSFETCFEPARFLSGGAPDEPESIKVRRRAFAVIMDYNRLMVRLASGAEGEALGGEVNQLASSVGGFATMVGLAPAGPLGSALGATVGPLVALVENLQAGQELRRLAIDGGPVVQKLLEALLAETPRMYALKRESALKRMEKIELDLKNEAQFTAEELVEVHARPADTSRLETLSQRINTALGRADLPSVALVNVAGRAGSAPFDQAAEDQLGALAERGEELADAHQAELEGLTTYYQALGQYVRLIDQTGQALNQVIAAARAPRTITLNSPAFAAQAAETTLQAREVRRLLDAI